MEYSTIPILVQLCNRQIATTPRQLLLQSTTILLLNPFLEVSTREILALVAKHHVRICAVMRKIAEHQC